MAGEISVTRALDVILDDSFKYSKVELLIEDIYSNRKRLRVNLRRALGKAKSFVIYQEPDGDPGSFEPIKAIYKDGEKVWEVTCRYTKDARERKAIISIANISEEIIGFEIIE